MGAYPQPSEDDIQAFRALLPDVPLGEVISRLQNNNRNVDQAVGEYFDDLDNPSRNNKYRWDEAQFSADRDGGDGSHPAGNHGISFDIQGPDVPGTYNQYNTAPSRPPSRTSNNKSPLGGIIDLTPEAAVADPSTSKTYMEHGDTDLEQALAASRAEAGLPPQDSGITSTNAVYFGPATRPQYEQGKWEMVPVGNRSANDTVSDPEPADRRREIDAPAFLKPSVENHRLSALFTIYHEIPIIREVFLGRIDVLPNYGFDKEWWAGKTIELPTVLGDEEPPEREVAREIQRLMAFLDNTERAYGSVEALANLRDVTRSLRWNSDAESAVLGAWRRAFEGHQAVVNKLFSRGVPCEAEEARTKEFAILELLLPAKESLQSTLYDIADEALWPSLVPLDLDQSPYLSHIAEIIAFKIDGDESSKSIDIPAVWYPDRYLKSARQAALNMRLQKHDIQENLRGVYILERDLTHYPIREGKTIKVKDLFQACLQHDEAQIQNDDQNQERTNMDGLSTDRPSKTSKLSMELRKLVASIDKKLLALNSEKDKAREALKNLSKLYTEPSEDPTAIELHPYSLRGVSTTKNTIYVCRRAEPNLIDMDLDNDQVPSPGDQWWRMHYAAGGPNHVTVEKTTEEKVLEAAKSESKNTVLVYASKKAMDFPINPLPTPLEAFTRADNRAFKAEFAEAEDAQTQLSSPGKRKFDEQSENSQDSAGRWNGGGGGSPRERESSSSVLEREMGETDGAALEDSRTASQRLTRRLMDVPEGTAEVIEGIDPSLPTRGPPAGQEMQERGNMRLGMMGGGTTFTSESRASTVDSMDLHEVLEDARATGEGAAKVGFSS